MDRLPVPVAAGYSKSAWPGEDGGPTRHQRAIGHPGLLDAERTKLVATNRLAIAATMVVFDPTGRCFLLTHGVGPSATCAVEEIDPITLETLRTSGELAGGAVWPGGLAVHANGDLYLAFGNHVHRLTTELEVLASRTLDRDAPHNSFVLLDSGHLVVKDFGGVLPDGRQPHPRCLVEVLEPATLSTVAHVELDEPSIARLSASGQEVYVVGTTSAFAVHFDPITASMTNVATVPYRTLDGQGYGWDPVVVGRALVFLDNGEGAERFDGTFLGKGVAQSPTHLVVVDLDAGTATLTAVTDELEGLICNPPLVDPDRGLVVGFDAARGVLAAFEFTDGTVGAERWRRRQAHASHLLALADSGQLVCCDFDVKANLDVVVVLDLETGAELGRVATESPLQSALFPAPGPDGGVYYCSFSHVVRVAGSR